MDGITRIIGDFKGIFIDSIRKLIELDGLDQSIAIKEYERGYILAIPVFAGIILDSAISRTIYQDKSFELRGAMFSQLGLDLKLSGIDSKIFNYLNEIFLLRDSIEHNHLYGFSIIDNKRVYTDKVAGFDTMIKKYASDKNKTDFLNLHIIPDEINIQDCRIIAKSLLEILVAFGELNNQKLKNFFNGFLVNSYYLPGQNKSTNLKLELEKFQNSL